MSKNYNAGENIAFNYPIKDSEYQILEDKFENLLHHASWQLLRKNYQNNHTEDEEDVVQELRLSMIRAGSYYKRQIYIESCLKAAKQHVSGIAKMILLELEYLWENRTRHGANRQKFGSHQEAMLINIVNLFVPHPERPDSAASLKIDAKFSTYCKAIAWNAQKSIGKKITKDKFLRSSQVSVSEYDYLACNN